MYGGQVAEVVAKACFEPSTLINAELFILDRYVAGVGLEGYESKLNNL